jgi:hypothetical protein
VRWCDNAAEESHIQALPGNCVGLIQQRSMSCGSDKKLSRVNMRRVSNRQGLRHRKLNTAVHQNSNKHKSSYAGVVSMTEMALMRQIVETNNYR